MLGTRDILEEVKKNKGYLGEKNSLVTVILEQEKGVKTGLL